METKECIIEEKLSANNNFKVARDFTEKFLGIKLTLIELVELKNYTEFTTELYKQDISHGKSKLKLDHIFQPEFESALIFMNKNYGTQIYSVVDKSDFRCLQHDTKELLGFDYYPEYFKRQQEEMHIP